MPVLIFLFYSCFKPSAQVEPPSTKKQIRPLKVARSAFGYNPNKSTSCSIEVPLPTSESVTLTTWGIDRANTLAQATAISSLFWVSWRHQQMLNVSILNSNEITDPWKSEQYDQIHVGAEVKPKVIK